MTPNLVWATVLLHNTHSCLRKKPPLRIQPLVSIESTPFGCHSAQYYFSTNGALLSKPVPEAGAPTKQLWLCSVNGGRRRRATGCGWNSPVARGYQLVSQKNPRIVTKGGFDPKRLLSDFRTRGWLQTPVGPGAYTPGHPIHPSTW